MTKEEKLQELINKAAEKYSPQQKNLLTTAIRGLVAEAEAKKIPLDIEKPEKGFSLDEIVKMASDSIDQLSTPSPDNKPKDDKPKDEPADKNDRTKEAPDPPKKPGKKDDNKDPQILPSGARVPDDIDPNDVSTIEVTNPITLADTKKIVAARNKLKAAQQTSKQDTQSMEKLKQIIVDINSKETDN